MADKVMFIPNVDTQHYTFCRVQLGVETRLNEPTNQNSRKVPKVVGPINKKRYFTTFVTSVINCPMSLSSQIPFQMLY